ncbi:MAG: hypothetical protein ACE5H4_10035 [Candidatus Thorarchaeota archaeon]
MEPLQNYTQLKELHIGSNQIGHLDLTPLTECKQLELLVLNSNPIREIDLSPIVSISKLLNIGIDPSVIAYLDSEYRGTAVSEAIENLDQKGLIIWQ